MTKPSLADVRQTCSEGRFFAYDHWVDRLFVPSSIVLVWLFVRLGWSGNAVSWLSGAVAVAGGILMASAEPWLILIGSFGYIAFYLLDYVDGGVSRYRGHAGVSGQYIDWIMHVVSAVAISAGLFAGALTVAGTWIVPFGILTVVASALMTARFSMAWFAICMTHQQHRVKGTSAAPQPERSQSGSRPFVFRALRWSANRLFHETYAIFLLPTLAILQLLLPHFVPDFRVVLIVLGGLLYFPMMVWDISLLVKENKIDEGYRKLFYSDELPSLPRDHFFS